MKYDYLGRSILTPAQKRAEKRAGAAGQAVASPRDLQVQVEQLTQMVEGIAARLNEPARRSLWQRVFGKQGRAPG